jgi:triosephosphate isomerase
MNYIFVNLKRFDVPKKLGGVCPEDDPGEWIHKVVSESVGQHLGKYEEVHLVFFPAEALVLRSVQALYSYPEIERGNIAIGCQGVFREDVTPGGNFGAFTTNLPAASAVNMGCTWTIVGHSEERKDKLGIITAYESLESENSHLRAVAAVDGLINQELICALEVGLDGLLCIGETAEERGEGDFEAQKPRIKTVLRGQLERGLKAVGRYADKRRIVIGYEPIWAIGPGKTPPGPEYIGIVSNFIKQTVKSLYGFTPPVVYGGGLKEENAAAIAGIDSVDGGLVALTRFTPPIGFDPEGLKKIMEKYVGGSACKVYRSNTVRE